MKHDDFLSELIEKNQPVIRLLTNQTAPQDDAEDAFGNLHQLISNEAIGDEALRDDSYSMDQNQRINWVLFCLP